jgi:hypothetical protein
MNLQGGVTRFLVGYEGEQLTGKPTASASPLEYSHQHSLYAKTSI